MPFIQGWVEAPKNPDLTVNEVLPHGIAERSGHFAHYRYAYGLTADEQYRNFHFCEFCAGWIEGDANHFKENTLGYLSGFRGDKWYCARCGECIGRTGAVS